jgi:hypothetical protein
MMTQRLKLFYGLLGAVVGLCIGTFLKNFSTMEALSRCDTISLPSIQLKCKFDELLLLLFASPLLLLIDKIQHWSSISVHVRRNVDT